MPLFRREVDEVRDILTVTWSLDRPVEAVWAHLTNAQGLTEWLGIPLTFDGAVSGEIRVDHGDGYVCRSIVKRVEPINHLFEVSWQFPDEHATRIEVRLDPVDTDEGSSQLILRHAELAALRDSYAQGWVTHLAFFEASLDGTPLPLEQFWNLHATFGALDVSGDVVEFRAGSASGGGKR